MPQFAAGVPFMGRAPAYPHATAAGVKPEKSGNRRVAAAGYATGGRACAIAILVLLPLLSSCGFLQQAVSEEWKWARPSPYLQTYEKWTREGRVYTGLSTEMTAQATLMSPEFREALIDKRSQDFLYSPEEKQQLLDTARIDSRKALDFTVFIFTPEAKYSELRPPDSVWEIRLENASGQSLKPSGVEKLPHPYEVLIRDFPKTNRWAFPYLVRFEAPDSGTPDFILAPSESVTLCVTGALGTVRMSWECDWMWPSD